MAKTSIARYATCATYGSYAMLAVASVFAYACGSANDMFSADPAGAERTGADAGASAPSPSAGIAGDTPLDNAVILVHAAKSQAFRLCFEKELDRRPQPDSQVMPEANVVGVEVGSAVRLGPLAGRPGKVYLFEEPIIGPFYPVFGGAGAGPTCRELLANTNLNKAAQLLGTVDADLSRGVHLLVVRGCAGDSVVKSYSVAECGETWTSTKGNLGVTEITLPGARRDGPGVLPAQVVNLSLPLDNARANRSVLVTFGDVVAAGASHVPVATNPPLFGSPSPAAPAQLSYASDDTAIYESLGFRVQLDGSDGGAGTTVLSSSLAVIQKASSPRDVPPTYYSTASNYALLLLGDPNAKLQDGGPDTDERRSLHLLAVPVVEPKSDGGVDAGAAPAAEDGGVGTTP